MLSLDLVFASTASGLDKELEVNLPQHTLVSRCNLSQYAYSLPFDIGSPDTQAQPSLVSTTA